VTVVHWTAMVHAGAVVSVVGWQWFAAWSLCHNAAAPWAVRDLDAAARRAGRSVAGLVVGRGLGIYCLCAVATALTGGLLRAAGTAVLQASTPDRAVAGWLASSPTWAPTVTAVLAFVTTAYLLTREGADRGDVTLKPWVAALLPMTGGRARGVRLQSHLSVIRADAQAAQMRCADDAADRVAAALPYVIMLSPAVLQRRVESVVSTVRSPRSDRFRRRLRRQLTPVVRRLLAQYERDLVDVQSERDARAFWYQAVLRELVAYGGADSLARLTFGLDATEPVPSPVELVRPPVVVDLRNRRPATESPDRRPHD
jgi:hypothetical protein